MLRKLLSHKCRFCHLAEFPCEDGFWRTLGLSGVLRGRVELHFVYDLDLPDPPIVGAFYTDGKWHTTPQTISYDAVQGWSAVERYTAPADSTLNSEEQLAKEIDAYRDMGWKFQNHSLFERLGRLR